MASIAQFLLQLSHDQAEHKLFSSSVEAAKGIMDKAGLNAEQQAIVLGGDPQKIGDAVQSELKASSPSGVQGTAVGVSFCICPPGVGP